jgi:muramidase (phage lysozyme)
MTNSTFKAQKEKNNKLVKDFGPNSQDYAVIEIFKGVGAYEYIIAGNLDKVVAKLIKDQWGNTQFASLPGGGQEPKNANMINFKEIFKNNIANELNDNSNISLKIGETIN